MSSFSMLNNGEVNVLAIAGLVATLIWSIIVVIVSLFNVRMIWKQWREEIGVHLDHSSHSDIDEVESGLEMQHFRRLEEE